MGTSQANFLIISISEAMKGEPAPAKVLRSAMCFSIAFEPLQTSALISTVKKYWKEVKVSFTKPCTAGGSFGEQPSAGYVSMPTMWRTDF